MKIYATIGKVVAAIAAIAGIAYLIVKYMDTIKAWLNKLCPCSEVDLEDDFVTEADIPEEPSDETPDEEPADDAAEAIPAEDTAAEAAPTAEETDFEA